MAKFRLVSPGDEYVERVEGGVFRRKVQVRGFVVETDQGDEFLPYDEVIATIGLMAEAKSSQVVVRAEVAPKKVRRGR